MLPVSSGQSAVIGQRRQVSQYKVTAICLSADLLGKQSVLSSKTRQLIFQFRLGKNRVTLETALKCTRPATALKISPCRYNLQLATFTLKVQLATSYSQTEGNGLTGTLNYLTFFLCGIKKASVSNRITDKTKKCDERGRSGRK